MKFRTTILQGDKTATGIDVPADVIESLGGGKRPPVTVTLDGRYSYRSSVAVLGGRFMVGLSAEHRAVSGFEGGDPVEVTLALDTEPRTVELPPVLAAALDAEPAARATFDGLSYSNRSWHVSQITGAKTDETRDRRIAKSIATLREGRPR